MLRDDRMKQRPFTTVTVRINFFLSAACAFDLMNYRSELEERENHFNLVSTNASPPSYVILTAANFPRVLLKV